MTERSWTTTSCSRATVAADLYHRFAADLPIIDYHCHLSPEQMAADHRFRSITEIWLDGDHYKWRAMRANGVPERYCTGDATDWEKFEAWARTVPDTMRNPLYHWTHMELRRPFGVDALLSPATARDVFDRCNERLQEDGFTALGLLRSFRVAVVCTTDDPVDSLGAPPAAGGAARSRHARLSRRGGPDKVFAVEDPAAFNAWVARLEQASRPDGRRAALVAARGAQGPPRRLPRDGLPRVGPRPRDAVRRAVDRRARSTRPSTGCGAGQPLDAGGRP